MIEQLIQRLRDYATDYVTIDHAWTLEPESVRSDDLPYAFFVPGMAQSDPSESLPIRQRVTEHVVVLTICRWTALDALRNQLYGALLGYQHAPEYTELEYSQGEISRIAGDVVHWLDMFTCHRWIGPAPLPATP